MTRIDPVHAIIYKHKVAYAAMRHCFDSKEPDEEVMNRLVTNEVVARFEMLRATPTTLFGVADLLAYAGSEDGLQAVDLKNIDGPNETFLSSAFEYVPELSVSARELPARMAAVLRRLA